MELCPQVGASAVRVALLLFVPSVVASKPEKEVFYSWIESGWAHLKTSLARREVPKAKEDCEICGSEVDFGMFI